MFTTGSKLLIGSAAAAWVFAAVYGVAQEGALGTIGLISAALALSLLAAVNVAFRDSNVSAMDHESFEASAAAQATARSTPWPLLVALGATTLTLGLVTYRTIFVLGLIAIVAGAIEWMIQGWSERASADRAFNAEARDVLVDPLELPVAAAIGGAVVVYAFSRVMLGLPSKSATVAAFAIVAALVLTVGGVIGIKRGISKATLTGTFSLVGVALIAGGAVAGLNGERETHPHETTGVLAEENACGPEETEADERASQSVAGKSNPAAEVFFADDRLSAEVTGLGTNFDSIQLPRSNANNVLFHNESDTPVRLVIELHPDTDDNGLPLGPERLCTALVEEGGTQLLTVLFDRPSRVVDGGFAFTVPGTDAELEVVVP
jgi:hypothetical protein